MFALTAIKGVGRRYSNIVLKKADVNLDKRAGECSEEEVEKIITIMSNPRQYKIPDWFLNRQKDIIDGKYSQVSVLFFCWNNGTDKRQWCVTRRRHLLVACAKAAHQQTCVYTTCICESVAVFSACTEEHLQALYCRVCDDATVTIVNHVVLFIGCVLFVCSWRPPRWIQNFAKIWRGWRRFAPTGVCVTTGVWGCVVSTRKPPEDVVALLVCLRRSKKFVYYLRFNKKHTKDDCFLLSISCECEWKACFT